MTDYLYAPHTDKIGFVPKWDTPTNPISGYYPSIVPFAIPLSDYKLKHKRLMMRQMRIDEKEAAKVQNNDEHPSEDAEAESSFYH